VPLFGGEQLVSSDAMRLNLGPTLPGSLVKVHVGVNPTSKQWPTLCTYNLSYLAEINACVDSYLIISLDPITL
jgi:hypothetical protein